MKASTLPLIFRLFFASTSVSSIMLLLSIKKPSITQNSLLVSSDSCSPSSSLLLLFSMYSTGLNLNFGKILNQFQEQVNKKEEIKMRSLESKLKKLNQNLKLHPKENLNRQLNFKFTNKRCFHMFKRRLKFGVKLWRSGKVRNKITTRIFNFIEFCSSSFLQ
jgi:hypothetical protein